MGTSDTLKISRIREKNENKLGCLKRTRWRVVVVPLLSDGEEEGDFSQARIGMKATLFHKEPLSQAKQLA